MNRFFIVALPDKENLEKLNKIRLFFNMNGFRDGISDRTNDAHITIASGVYEGEKQIKDIEAAYIEALKEIEPFEISYDHVTNEYKPPNDEKEFEHNWIALRFRDKNLIKLAEFCDKVLQKLGISTTQEYVDYIHKTVPSSKDENVVGDHMNMCIWCLTPKAEEAYEKCVNETPKKFEIAKIAFRYTVDKHVKHAWEIDL